LHKPKVRRHVECIYVYVIILSYTGPTFYFQKMSAFPIVEWRKKREHEQRWIEESIYVWNWLPS